MNDGSNFYPGLEGIKAGKTAISYIDGQNGLLTIRDIPIELLVSEKSFEDIILDVIWGNNSSIPYTRETLNTEILKFRKLDNLTITALEHAAKEDWHVMDALRLAISTLNPSSEFSKNAINIMAKLPIIVGNFYRLKNGLKILTPSTSGYASSILELILDRTPNPEEIKTLEIYLTCVVDHGFNNSTFTGRCVMSTKSDEISALTASIGSLKGPLHGGAPSHALKLIQSLSGKSKDEIELFVKNAVNNKEKIMGFGHRVYKTKDPRAKILEQRAFEIKGNSNLVTEAIFIEENITKALAKFKPNAKLYANVEYYTSVILSSLNIPSYLFTGIFTCSRAIGWLGHYLEERTEGRIIRPSSYYTGKKN